jgi:hypothetical protein
MLEQWFIAGECKKPRLNATSSVVLALTSCLYILTVILPHLNVHLIMSFRPTRCIDLMFTTSTDQFKLKVISQSELYIHALNVSCIVLVYYFVPFIVSNRYLLFSVSSGHVQNRTHVYMNFFDYKDLGNHLLQ